MEEAHDAQPRLVMTELRRAAFSGESHVRASWLPTSDFILRHDGSWRTPRTDERIIEQANNKSEMNYTIISISAILIEQYRFLIFYREVSLLDILLTMMIFLYSF